MFWRNAWQPLVVAKRSDVRQEWGRAGGLHVLVRVLCDCVLRILYPPRVPSSEAPVEYSAARWRDERESWSGLCGTRAKRYCMARFCRMLSRIRVNASYRLMLVISPFTSWPISKSCMACVHPAQHISRALIVLWAGERVARKIKDSWRFERFPFALTKG